MKRAGLSLLLLTSLAVLAGCPGESTDATPTPAPNNQPDEQTPPPDNGTTQNPTPPTDEKPLAPDTSKTTPKARPALEIALDRLAREEDRLAAIRGMVATDQIDLLAESANPLLSDRSRAIRLATAKPLFEQGLRRQLTRPIIALGEGRSEAKRKMVQKIATGWSPLFQNAIEDELHHASRVDQIIMLNVLIEHKARSDAIRSMLERHFTKSTGQAQAQALRRLGLYTMSKMTNQNQGETGRQFQALYREVASEADRARFLATLTQLAHDRNHGRALLAAVLDDRFFAEIEPNNRTLRASAVAALRALIAQPDSRADFDTNRVGLALTRVVLDNRPPAKPKKEDKPKDSPETVQQAIEALSKIPWRSPPAIEALITMMLSSDRALAQGASDAAHTIGLPRRLEFKASGPTSTKQHKTIQAWWDNEQKRFSSSVAELMKPGSPAEAQAAINRAIPRLNKKIGPTGLTLLAIDRSADSARRVAAIRILAVIPSLPGRAGDLTGLLGDPDAAVRLATAKTLTAQRLSTGLADPLIALVEGDAPARLRALKAIRLKGDRLLTNALLAQVGHSDRTVRASVLQLLADWQIRSPGLLAAAADRFERAPKPEKRLAAETVARLAGLQFKTEGWDKAVAVSQKLYTAADPAARSALLAGFGEAARTSGSCRRLLATLFSPDFLTAAEPTDRARRGAIIATLNERVFHGSAAYYDRATGVVMLRRILQDNTPPRKSDAPQTVIDTANSLARIDPITARTALLPILAHDEPGVAMAAYRAIGAPASMPFDPASAERAAQIKAIWAWVLRTTPPGRSN